MQTLKANCKQFDNIKSKNNQVQSHSRPNRDIKLPTKLEMCMGKLDISYLK